MSKSNDVLKPILTPPSDVLKPILAFLIASIEDYDIKNAGFDDKEHFHKVQLEFVKAHEEKLLPLLMSTMKLIETRKLYVMDKEYMCPCLCSGMYISKKNRITLIGLDCSENKVVDIPEELPEFTKDKIEIIQMLLSNFDYYDIERASSGYDATASASMNFDSDEMFKRYQIYFGGRTSPETAAWIKRIFRKLNKIDIVIEGYIEFDASCVFFDKSGSLVVGHER